MPVQTIIESVSRTIRRKSAVVLANKGFTVSAVAELVGCGVSTVSRRLERIVNTGDIIDLPRSGRPAIYSETFKLELRILLSNTAFSKLWTVDIEVGSSSLSGTPENH